MIKLLCRIFVRNIDSPEDPDVRAACGVFSGWMGIAVNIVLFGIKLTVGILSGSIAVAADAINNLSDAGSGAITILGFKMASKPADREHPFGHGRIELCCAVVVSVVIMMMGFDLLKESIGKIITPGEVKMTPLMIGLVAGSLLFKLWLFFFYRSVGKLIQSGTLLASAFDSLSDMVGTSVVLLALFSSKFTTLPVDGIAGVLVAGLILIGGGKLLRDTISPLLGEPPSAEFVAELQSRLLQCPGINGVHDIIIHNYGPNQYFATAHAEIELKGDLLAAHDLLESAEVEIGKHMPVNLLLHCDPSGAGDLESKKWRVRLEDAAAVIDPHFKLYDFRLREESGILCLTCHLLIPRNYRISKPVLHETLRQEMKKYDSAIELQIVFIHPYV